MTISLEFHEKVALIVMDDGKRNALTVDAIGSVNEHLDEAEAKSGAIVLAGRPGSFSAGFDLAVMTGDDPEARSRLRAAGARAAVRLYSLGKPLVAACTGHTLTIGAIWAAAFDTRIGERGDYKFGLVETALGMTLPRWALEPLHARLIKSEWIPAITQSKIYGPEDALAAGFLDQLVDAGEAVDRALETAAELAKLPAVAYAGNKLAMRGDALDRMRASMQ